MNELNWRTLSLGALLCVVAAAATSYITLKLGQSGDFTMAAMFIAAFVLEKRITGRELAIQLNIIQTMIGVVSGIAFMVVILSAFYYIKTIFHRDIDFHPSFWQMFIWLLISANLGVFMGIIPRNAVLKDRSLPWPASKATLSVAKTLADLGAAASTKLQRDVLMVTTAISSFLTFLRDGLGVIQPIVGNAALNVSLGLEPMAMGLGMLVPLSVGLSGLLGTYIVSEFGEAAAQYAALSGVATENLHTCIATIGNIANLGGAEKASALAFLSNNCGQAVEYIHSTSHFKYVVQWMMWPATAMMIAAAITSVLISLIKNFKEKRNAPPVEDNHLSLADEHIPTWWIVVGISVCVVLLVWLMNAWFAMSWIQVLLAVAIQPLLIIAGLRVLAITGNGPVSLMTNATQFVFGLLWPASIRANLSAAYISASPQASSESVVSSFWVAQRLGGRFTTLILAQLIIIPIGAILTPLIFEMLQHTYGIGSGHGQLLAPTGLKIATLAMVMEKGLTYLPPCALTASMIAIGVGIGFELLLSFRKTDSQGTSVAHFWWVPIPAALGFALILPASLNIGIALGSIVAAIWNKFSAKAAGSFELYNAPVASGLIVGEAVVASILLPTVAIIRELFTS